MKTSISRKHLSLAACVLALGFASSATLAQDVSRANPNDRELWENASKTVWMSGYGLCWHSGFGPPPGYGPCNPAPIAQAVVAPIAAVAAASSDVTPAIGLPVAAARPFTAARPTRKPVNPPGPTQTPNKSTASIPSPALCSNSLTSSHKRSERRSSLGTARDSMICSPRAKATLVHLADVSSARMIGWFFA